MVRMKGTHLVEEDQTSLVGITQVGIGLVGRWLVGYDLATVAQIIVPELVAENGHRQ